MTKQCMSCDKILPIERFSYKHKNSGVRQSVCKQCAQEYGRRWRAAHPDEIRANMKTYYSQNREALLAQKREYYNANQETIKRKVATHYYDNHEGHKQRAKQLAMERKVKVFEHYGARCICCGETNIGFLSIDHIRNDGADHRRKVGAGWAMYRWLIKNNFPDGFQVLCYNCNLGRFRNGNVCPHKTTPCESE